MTRRHLMLATLVPAMTAAAFAASGHRPETRIGRRPGRTTARARPPSSTRPHTQPPSAASAPGSPTEPAASRATYLGLLQLRTRGREQLVARRQLDPGAARAAAALALGRVDRVPAVGGDEVRHALGEQRVDLLALGALGLRERAQVLGQAVDGLLRVALVGAEDPGRPALDPADRVDAGELLAVEASTRPRTLGRMNERSSNGTSGSGTAR